MRQIISKVMKATARGQTVYRCNRKNATIQLKYVWSGLGLSQLFEKYCFNKIQASWANMSDLYMVLAHMSFLCFLFLYFYQARARVCETARHQANNNF